MDSAPSATSPNHSKRNTSPMEPPELFPSAVPVATARVRPMDAVGFNWLLSALAAVPQSRAVAAVLTWLAAPGASATSCDGADPLTCSNGPRGPFRIP